MGNICRRTPLIYGYNKFRLAGKHITMFLILSLLEMARLLSFCTPPPSETPSVILKILIYIDNAIITRNLRNAINDYPAYRPCYIFSERNIRIPEY